VYETIEKYKKTMIKIEQLHLEAITSVHDDGESSIKSAEITEKIAIEFVEWRDTKLKELNKWILNDVPMGDKFTTKELFDEFLKTKTL
jgi:hypothetical protein